MAPASPAPFSPPALFVPPADADGLADALVAGQLSPRTRRAYAADLAELLAVLGAWGVGLPGVTRDHLHAYRAWLGGQDVPGLVSRPRCAPATVSRKVSVCRRLFAEALDRGLTGSDPPPACAASPSRARAFISLALDGGAPLHKVQAAAGHADPRTTERY